MNVAIVGVSGYTGLELVKILLRHPKFKLEIITNQQGGIDISKLHPSLLGVLEKEVKKTNVEEIAKNCELVFLALPHKQSMPLAKQFLQKGLKVVDLSADYRLELDTYEKYYCPHIDKQNLKQAVYGLPEFYEEDIKKAKLIANPGCYPSASLLGILPFVPFLDENMPIFIDAKSGLSGAGKGLSENAHFVNINENSFAYDPLSHRHMPEIKEKIQILSKKSFEINFVPQLLPLTRGMLVSIYAILKDEYQNLDTNKVLQKAYEDKKFIRLRENPVDIKSTSGTNFCDIFAKSNKKGIFINTSIDNLLRGASSQAVLNANLMCGYEQSFGIEGLAYVP